MDFEQNKINPETTPLVSPDDKMENPDNNKEKLNQEIVKEIDAGLKISEDCEEIIDEMGGKNGVEAKFDSCSPEQKTSMLSRFTSKVKELSHVASLPVVAAIAGELVGLLVYKVGGDQAGLIIGHLIAGVMSMGLCLAVAKDYYQGNTVESQSI